MSHHAIDNLLDEIVDVFAAAGDSDLAAAPSARHTRPHDGGLPGVTYAKRSTRCCATPSSTSSPAPPGCSPASDMRDAPVDVLLIDEAGQLALADALAASTRPGTSSCSAIRPAPPGRPRPPIPAAAGAASSSTSSATT